MWSGEQEQTCTLKVKPFGQPASASSFLAFVGIVGEELLDASPASLSSGSK